jgi:hypothetical protein
MIDQYSKNAVGGEAKRRSHIRMRSALEPVLSKALIWLSRGRCLSMALALPSASVCRFLGLAQAVSAHCRAPSCVAANT